MPKSLIFLETGVRNVWHRGKGLLLKAYLRLHGCRVGRRLKCKSWPIFRNYPFKNITFGDFVTIGYGITLDLSGEGKLLLGDRVNLTQNILISASAEVRIGSWTLVAENVSIRDSDHQTLRKEPIATQKIVSKPIRIGDDVWIGAGCFILKGAVIKDGAVIGANSVVTERSLIDENGIYAGSPVTCLKARR